jgi:hypothetical protein
MEVTFRLDLWVYGCAARPHMDRPPAVSLSAPRPVQRDYGLYPSDKVGCCVPIGGGMLKSARFGHVGHSCRYRLARAKLTDGTQLSRMGNVIYGTNNAWESIAQVGGPVLRATTHYRPQFEPIPPIYRRKLKALRDQPYSTTVAPDSQTWSEQYVTGSTCNTWVSCPDLRRSLRNTAQNR